MHALIESEMLHLESSTSPLYEQDGQFHISEAKDFDDKDQTEVDLTYEIEDSLDFIDNDEKHLLNHQLIDSGSK